MLVVYLAVAAGPSIALGERQAEDDESLRMAKDAYSELWQVAQSLFDAAAPHRLAAVVTLIDLEQRPGGPAAIAREILQMLIADPDRGIATLAEKALLNIEARNRGQSKKQGEPRVEGRSAGSSSPGSVVGWTPSTAVGSRDELLRGVYSEDQGIRLASISLLEDLTQNECASGDSRIVRALLDSLDDRLPEIAERAASALENVMAAENDCGEILR